MKKHAGTIVLVALAVALVVWLVLDRDRVTEGERKRRENSAFVVWRREELTRISIAHDGESIVLERDRPSSDKPSSEGKEGQWRLTSPRQERADPVAVERLLTTLEFANVARKVADGAPLGLDNPRAVGAVRMGGLEVSFALGGPSPRPEGSSYFRVGDATPIVISKEVADALLAPSDTYRDRTVVPYLATELARVEVKHGDRGFSLARIDDHSFRVEETGVLAARAGVDRLWAALAEMRAEAFPKDADAERLTAHPVATVKLFPKDASKPAAELVVGEACPGHPADVVVLRKAPHRVAACAPQDIVGYLSGDAAGLADKHPFSLRMDEIEELRLEHGAETIEIARKGTGFHQRAPTDRELSEAEADAATQLLERIAISEAKAVSRGASNASPFVSTGRAVVRTGEREQVVEIGAPGPDGRTTLRRLIDDARLEVDASVLRRLVPRGTTLRPRTVLDHEARRPTRVLLRCGVDQELVDKGEGFRLVTPTGYETDGAILQLVDALTKGRIDVWVADEDDGSFGFTKDGCHVILTFEDGNAPVTVWFGAEAEGGVYVKAEPRTGVLVAPRAVRDLAKSLYVSRGMLRTDAAKIERVKVTSHGRPVTPRDAVAATEALAALYVDRVVSLTKLDGAPDLVIDVAVTEGGPPRRIACRSV
ncbi:MAG: hypothetical protein JWO86_9206, partial [Myxococcaceae bacterium]|nr:hypothetical protein [Myxococcaceae bacterium]